MCNLYGHIRLSEQDWVNQTAFHTKIYETVCVTQSVVGSTQVLRIPVESVCHLHYKKLTTGLQFRVFNADTDRRYTRCKGTSAQACDHLAAAFDEYLHHLALHPPHVGGARGAFKPYKIDDKKAKSLPLRQPKKTRRLSVRHDAKIQRLVRSGAMSTKTLTYRDLHDHLFERCVATPKFL